MVRFETTLVRKLTWRIVPLLMVCYFIAYLERVNVGFAALTMNHALGFSATTFGVGAGMFSVGYLLFEVPLSLLFNRYGARVTFSRTMLVWGLIACCMAMIWNGTSYFVLRFLLGVAEAGFSPGVMIYLSTWFPAKYRGRILSYFFLSLPLSSFIGAPISGYLVALPGWHGLASWQIMFLAEGLPAIVMAIVVLLFMSERPADAKWLNAEERDWLCAQTQPDQTIHNTSAKSLWQTLLDRRVLLLSIVYLGILLVHNSLSVWLPQMMKATGLTIRQTGLVIMLPYLAGIVGMLVWGWHSDKTQERKWHTAFAMMIAATGLVVAAFAADPVIKIGAVSMAMFGSFSALTVFWTLPTGFLAGPGAIGGVALISSSGSLAGLIGPALIGIVKDWTDSYTLGLSVISLMCLAATCLVMSSGIGARPPIEASLESTV